jgi:hypothetical protein
MAAHHRFGEREHQRRRQTAVLFFARSSGVFAPVPSLDLQRLG